MSIKLVAVRPWAQADANDVAALDTSFTTGTILDVTFDRGCFCIREVQLAAPLTKQYRVGDPADGQGAFVAELDGSIVGYGEVVVEPWNRRGTIRHLYVNARHRRLGIGSRLLDRLEAVARERAARSLWVETQNVNYPATHFYRSQGFVLVGLDTSLYDPRVTPGEVALFYERLLGGPFRSS